MTSSYPRRASLPSFFAALLAASSTLSSSCHAFSILPHETVHMIQTVAHTVGAQTHAPELLAAYKHQLSAAPLPTKMLTGATLAVAGDAIAQSQKTEEPYDVRRASSFAVFDMAYRALQHFSFPIIVQHCQGQLLGGASSALLAGQAAADQLHAAAAMEQTLASQLIIVPFFYYPVFFTLTGAMQGLDFNDSLSRAKENFLPLMKRNLLFWIPVQDVQFAFVPTDLQIPFLSCAGLAWTFILSLAAGSAKTYSATEQAERLSAVVAAEEQEEAMPIIVDGGGSKTEEEQRELLGAYTSTR